MGAAMPHPQSFRGGCSIQLGHKQARGVRIWPCTGQRLAPVTVSAGQNCSSCQETLLTWKCPPTPGMVRGPRPGGWRWAWSRVMEKGTGVEQQRPSHGSRGCDPRAVIPAGGQAATADRGLLNRTSPRGGAALQTRSIHCTLCLRLLGAGRRVLMLGTDGRHPSCTQGCFGEGESSCLHPKVPLHRHL